MPAMLVLHDAHTATAVAEYCEQHDCRVDVSVDPDQAARVARFQRYPTVICDVSFGDAFCSKGLEIARAAKRRDRSTRTVALATWMSPELQSAVDRGEIDVVLMKPQPLAKLLAHAV